MIIENLRLQQYRSYKDAAFEFGQGVNIIVGPNASGKTNLLEAIQVICLGASYRARERELVQFGKSWARLDADTTNGPRIVKIEFIEGATRATKNYTVQNQTMSRLPLARTIPTVLFEPEHLQLLRGRPELRRDYLDELLEQTTPGYVKLRRDYKRALSQRNALLKKGIGNAKQHIFAWDLRLSELGGQMAEHRQKLVIKLNESATAIYRKLAGSRTAITLAYSGHSTSYATNLLRRLEANLAEDCARGFTTDGPHRDDLLISLGGHPAQESASRGEVRTLLLALKILELKILEELRGEKPLLLLDDVFSELDGKRCQALTKFLRDYQTFITTTDADVVVQHFMDTATIIPTNK